MVMIVVIGRFLLYRRSQVDILPEVLSLWDQQGLLSFHGFMFRGGARGQYLGHHTFFLISWRLLDGPILYLRYWFSVKQTLTWNIVWRSAICISWFKDFTLCLEDYLKDKCHNLDIGSMWCKDLPYCIYVGQWPIFYGQVILSCIVKTIWWMNVVLEILIQCDTNIDLYVYNCGKRILQYSS